MHWANWSSLLLQTVKQSVCGAFLKKGSTLSFFLNFQIRWRHSSRGWFAVMIVVILFADAVWLESLVDVLRFFLFLFVFEIFLGTQCRKVAVVAVEDTWLRNADAEGRCAHLRCLSKLKTKNEILESLLSSERRRSTEHCLTQIDVGIGDNKHWAAWRCGGQLRTGKC